MRSYKRVVVAVVITTGAVAVLVGVIASGCRTAAEEQTAPAAETRPVQPIYKRVDPPSPPLPSGTIPKSPQNQAEPARGEERPTRAAPKRVLPPEPPRIPVTPELPEDRRLAKLQARLADLLHAGRPLWDAVFELEVAFHTWRREMREFRLIQRADSVYAPRDYSELIALEAKYQKAMPALTEHHTWDMLENQERLGIALIDIFNRNVDRLLQPIVQAYATSFTMTPGPETEQALLDLTADARKVRNHFIEAENDMFCIRRALFRRDEYGRRQVRPASDSFRRGLSW